MKFAEHFVKILVYEMQSVTDSRIAIANIHCVPKSSTPNSYR